MIVATAGHIDHGKTLLVKTLTGVDTDRLPEEKARGISIDLGFAYLPLPGGELIGFVDVPGHERFIRNMLAGVCGIDYALLIVAADDGVMPQTTEHLNILDLLHVGRGAAVITKTDRVDAARVQQVTEQVQALLAPTQLASAPVFPVSAVSGAGIDALRDHLARAAVTQAARQASGQHFRFAVDRAFTVAGSGTVVTGTIFNGRVKPGDKVTVSPAGNEVRVRGIQIRGKAAEQAAAGERCALNLTGADLESVSRGDWVLAAAIHRPTQRIVACMTVLASEAQALRHWMPVHLHLATTDVTARVAIRRGETLAPGASALVQLVLDAPTGALHGDRFILRDQSASRTLGGGIVIDPFSPSRRVTAARAAELAALEHTDPAAALSALMNESRLTVDLQRFETTYNLTPEHAASLYETAQLAQLGRERRIGVARARHTALLEAVVTHLADFHKRQPQANGEDIEVLRGALAADLSADAFSSVLRELTDARRIEAGGSIARLPGHNATANSADEKLWQVLRPALESAGYLAPTVKDLAAQLKLKEPIVKDFLHRKAKGGEVLKVTADRFYPRPTVAALAVIAQRTAQAQPAGMFTAAQYRDATGIGRSLAIEILEFMDTLGVTQRVGDARKMRKDPAALLGPPLFSAQKAPVAASRPAARPAARRPVQPYRR